MDRYFYSVEMDGDRKVVHISGNVYYAIDDSEDCYKLAEWTFMYIDIGQLRELIDEDRFFEYVNQAVNYLTNITKEEAIWSCKNYHNGASGTELDITLVNEDTPCGDYWFE